MTRMLAFVAAMLLTAITVSSACVANSAAPLQFTIEPAHHAGEIYVRFKRDRNGHSENNWSTSFRPSELAGLDIAALDRPGTREIRFAIVRDAGRIDCAGTGGNQMAQGSCGVTTDGSFLRLLEDNRIGRPTDDQLFAMVAVNVRRDLIAALAQSHYPTPTVEQLIELSAVDVTPAYIRALAGQGYRPASINGLVEFGALKITPEFIAGFDRIGYGRLPVDTLVQLKAMDITPDYVRAVEQGGALPSPDHLVQLKAVSDEIRKR